MRLSKITVWNKYWQTKHLYYYGKYIKYYAAIFKSVGKFDTRII